VSSFDDILWFVMGGLEFLNFERNRVILYVLDEIIKIKMKILFDEWILTFISCSYIVDDCLMFIWYFKINNVFNVPIGMFCEFISF